MYGPVLSVNGGFVSVNGENIFGEKVEMANYILLQSLGLQPSDCRSM
jgi:hypothetical protein